MKNSIIIVSPHFKRREYACRCGCGFEAVDVELLMILEALRDEFSRKVVINSGCRCEAWNRHIEGAKKSYHVKGMAADIRVEHTPASIIQDYLEETYPDKYGIGCYRDFSHIDVRREMARWEGKL